MLIIGDCCLLDWEESPFPVLFSRPIVKVKEANTIDPCICGRIWVQETTNKEWYSDLSNYYGAGCIEHSMKHYTSPRFPTMQEARDDVDKFLLRMQEMIAFL